MNPKSLALLSLLCAMTAGATTTTPTVTLPAQADLRPGERLALPDRTSLRYVGTFNDSRCPPDVQCIHAGDADVRIQLEHGDTKQDLVLRSSEPAPRISGRWRIAVLRLTHGPAPTATINVDSAP